MAGGFGKLALSMRGHEASGSHPVVHLFTPLLPFWLDTNALIREQAR